MSTNINLKNSTNTTFSITHSDGANTKVLDSKDIAVAIDTVADFPANPNNGDVVIVRDISRGGTFIYDSSEVAGSNDGTNFDGWIRQYSGAVNVKWFGAVDGQDSTTAIQNAIDSLSSNSSLSFDGLTQLYINSNGLNIMMDLDWKTGYTKTDRSNIEIDFCNCELVFKADVPFVSIFPNIPIWTQGYTAASTVSRQPTLIFVNMDGITIKNVVLNGNMQNRAVVNGYPGQLEHEATLYMCACKDFVIDNIITKDSMGDGITIGYPYNESDSNLSQCYGVNSLEGLCENFSISNTKHYRHSRLGIAFVGARYGNTTNVYAEQIDSITNFRSLAGPGSAIDVEYDSSNSYYNGLGYSLCEELNFDTITAKDCEYGGIFQVQAGKNITINNIYGIGSTLYGIGRYEGSSENVIINNATLTLDINNTQDAYVYLCKIGGKNVTVNNFKSNSVKTSSGFHILAGAVNATILNVDLSNAYFNDISASVFSFDGNSTFKAENINISFRASSVLRSPIVIYGANNNMSLNNINFTEETADATTLMALGRGFCHFNSYEGNKLSITNSQINVKQNSIYTSSSSSIILNSVFIDNVTFRGLMFFPSADPASSCIIKNTKVESYWNDGTSVSSMLSIPWYPNCYLELDTCTLNSTGVYGYNKCKKGVYIPSTSFASATTFKAKINNLILNGGRESDSFIDMVAYENGVYNETPWSTYHNQMVCTNINNNNFLGKRITLVAGTSVYYVGGTNYSTEFICYLPGQVMYFEKIDSNQGDFYIRPWKNGSYIQQAFMELHYASNLAANQILMIKG